MTRFLTLNEKFMGKNFQSCAMYNVCDLIIHRFLVNPNESSINQKLTDIFSLPNPELKDGTKYIPIQNIFHDSTKDNVWLIQVQIQTTLLIPLGAIDLNSLQLAEKRHKYTHKIHREWGMNNKMLPTKMYKM